MTFPNFVDKHDQEAIITPEAVIALHRQRAGAEELSTVRATEPPGGGAATYGLRGRGTQPSELVVPDGVVFAYQRTVWEHFDALGARLVEGYPGPWRTMRVLERDGASVGLVGGFGIGAPVAALILEELIALGVRRFLNIGAAGSLLNDCRFGDIVVADAAIRDEGVSHHYLPAAKFAYPSAPLTEDFAAALERRDESVRRGTTWTIDAVFRETVAEANSYQAEGVATVEMEAAALFAVGALRRVDVAAAFAVSDHLLVGEVWEPGFQDDALHRSLEALLDAAVDTLTSTA